jgi:hypothetical protein
VTVRCYCCDLPVESCGKAAETRQRREATRDRAALLARTGWFRAEWPGRCSRCGERFDADTPICRYDDGWRAECCA